MPSPKTLLIAQALISCMMAFLMNAIFSVVELGFNLQALQNCLSHFIVAWPIAFCLSIVVSKIAFDIANRLTAEKI